MAARVEIFPTLACDGFLLVRGGADNLPILANATTGSIGQTTTRRYFRHGYQTERRGFSNGMMTAENDFFRCLSSLGWGLPVCSV